jgi:hypothetical protein
VALVVPEVMAVPVVRALRLVLVALEVRPVLELLARQAALRMAEVLWDTT